MATPDLDELAKKVENAYKNVDSYSDTGVTRLRVSWGGKYEGSNSIFKTLFVRPSLFRFEWELHDLAIQQETSRTSVIWTDETEGYDSRTETVQSIQNAIRAIGDRLKIRAFFFPRIKGDFDIVSSPKKFVKEETFEDIDCYVIDATNEIQASEETSIFLWIGKKDFFIRKIYYKTPWVRCDRWGTKGEYSTEEIHRDIKINEPIAREVFRSPKPQPTIIFTPRVFSWDCNSKPKPQSVEIKITLPEGLELTDAKCLEFTDSTLQNKQFTAQLIPIEPRRHYRLEVTPLSTLHPQFAILSLITAPNSDIQDLNLEILARINEPARQPKTGRVLEDQAQD